MSRCVQILRERSRADHRRIFPAANLHPIPSASRITQRSCRHPGQLRRGEGWCNYTLPDPLRLAKGKPVRDAATWYKQRGPEVLHLFEENQFGRSPRAPAGLTYDRSDPGMPAFDGAAIRKQTTVYFSRGKNGPKMDLLVYLPAKAHKPVPVLLSISFSANSVTVDDPRVKWSGVEPGTQESGR